MSEINWHTYNGVWEPSEPYERIKFDLTNGLNEIPKNAKIVEAVLSFTIPNEKYYQAEIDALQARLDEAIGLLDRLSHWDMLNTNWDGKPATADGPYWKRNIDETLAKLRGEK